MESTAFTSVPKLASVPPEVLVANTSFVLSGVIATAVKYSWPSPPTYVAQLGVGVVAAFV